MIFRVGINIGDIIVEAHDIFGDGVNIAARLEGIAEPGGICISSSAYEQVRGRSDGVYRFGRTVPQEYCAPGTRLRRNPGWAYLRNAQSRHYRVHLPPRVCPSWYCRSPISAGVPSKTIRGWRD